MQPSFRTSLFFLCAFLTCSLFGQEKQEITEKDLKIEFSANAVHGTEIREGSFATVEFRITDATTGTPIVAANPAAWIDLQAENAVSDANACKEKISLYLRGMIGMRPVIDLNSYFILVLNRDASISVIDPLVGVTGKTSLYTSIPLSRPGIDWVKNSDFARLYVTMPAADKVAVIDLETFKVTNNIEAGENPVRIAIQPDRKYLWVGNNGREQKPGSVTVVDLSSEKVVARIPAGAGHHEIAFSADSRIAYVTSRDDGLVTVVDIQQLKKLRDIRTGTLPISLAFSPLSQAAYVADGRDGTVTVIDSQRHEIVSRISAKPGLGPQLVTPDGRWLLIVNSTENGIQVVDTSTNQLVRTIPVGAEPYQMSMTREFVYVRHLGTERVSMIALPDIQKNKENPMVAGFSAGSKPPKQAGVLSIAPVISVTSEEHSVIVANPNDGNVDYYMEGMNTPMGTFRNYGHVPLAVEIADRSLKEIEPGKYVANIRVPTSGAYEIPFLLRSPTIVHCFQMTSKPDLLARKSLPPLGVDYLMKGRKVKTGDTLAFQVRLNDPATGSVKTGLKDVQVTYFLAPGKMRRVERASEIEDGIYEARLPIAESGAYYFYVHAPSLNMKPDDLPFLTLQVMREDAVPAPGRARGRE